MVRRYLRKTRIASQPSLNKTPATTNIIHFHTLTGNYQ
jgi:hypothetical protein